MLNFFNFLTHHNTLCDKAPLFRDYFAIVTVRVSVQTSYVQDIQNTVQSTPLEFPGIVPNGIPINSFDFDFGDF